MVEKKVEGSYTLTQIVYTTLSFSYNFIIMDDSKVKTSGCPKGSVREKRCENNHPLKQIIKTTSSSCITSIIVMDETKERKGRPKRSDQEKVDGSFTP